MRGRGALKMYTLILAIAISLAGVKVEASPGIRLNALQILLPFSSEQSHRCTYLLTAAGGCFEWQNDNPHAVALTPIVSDDGCSHQAWITTVASTHRSSTSTITVTDVNSGQVAKCKARVEEIAKIEVDTTYRRLNWHEQEIVGLKGYDSDGNTMNNITGLKVKWDINTNMETEPLKIIPFTESNNVDMVQIVLDLEDAGHQSTKVLVEGQGTGPVDVIACLDEEGYSRNTIKASKDFIVIDPFNVLPENPQHVFPFGDIVYKLVKRGREVRLPDPQYMWKVKDDNVVNINKSGIGHALNAIGHTKVDVVDEFMPDNKQTRQINVLAPEQLGTSLIQTDPLIGCAKEPVPQRAHWYLLEGHSYDWRVQACHDRDCSFDQQHAVVQFIPNTDQNSIQVTKKHESTPDGHTFGLTALKAHSSLFLKATLNEFKRDELSFRLPSPIVLEQPYTVVTPLKVSSDRVYVPRKRSLAVHKSTLTVTGGSGMYRWEVMDPNVVSIADKVDNAMSQSVSFTAMGKGTTKVVVTDVNVCYNSMAVEVHIVDIVELKFLPTKIETTVGDTMTIPLSVIGQSIDGDLHMPFESCTSLPITFTSDNESVFTVEKSTTVPKSIAENDSVNATPGKSGCAALVVHAKKEGYTTLTAIYRDGNSVLTTNIKIFAYYPLQVVSSPEELHVVVGTEAELRASGGPLSWPMDTSKAIQMLSLQERNGVEMVGKVQKVTQTHNSRSEQIYVWSLRCKSLGSHIVEVIVGNKHTHMGFDTHISKIKTAVTCALPSSVGLPRFIDPVVGKSIDAIPDKYRSYPELVSLAEKCIGKMIFLTNTKNKFSVPVIGEGGKEALTKGLYMFKYTSSDATIAYIEDQSLNEKPRLITLAKQGTVNLTIKLAGVRGISTGSSNLPSYSFTIRVVKPIEMVQNTVDLYPNSTVTDIYPKLGSNVYHALSDNSNIASVSLINPNTARIRSGKTGVTLVHVKDVCFPSAEPATTTIIVHRVKQVDVHGCPSVVVQKPTFLYVKLTSDDGQTVSLKNMKASGNFDVRLHVSHPGLEVRTAENPRILEDTDEMRFTLFGKSTGTYQVEARVTFKGPGRAGDTVKSAVYSVRVEKPLSLNLSSRLFEGSEITYALGGDAQDHGFVVYHTSNSKVLSITKNGSVTAVGTGSADITATSEQFDPLTGARCVVSSATANVKVVSLSRFALVLPPHSVIKGARFAMHIMGGDGMTPLMFGSAGNLQFEWVNETPEIIDLRPRYHQAGLTLEEEGEVSVEVLAKGAGVGIVRLRMRHTNGRQAGEAVGHIHVIDPLTAKVLGVSQPPSIVMPTNSIADVTTNKLSDKCVLSVVSGTGVVNVLSLNGGISARSGMSEGEAVLEVVCTEEGGTYMTQQRNAFPVDVRAVSILMLIPTTKNSMVPVGTELCFKVVVRDRNGRVFNFAPSGTDVVRLKSSSEGVLNVNTISNSINWSDECHLKVRAAAVGHTVLQASWMGSEAIVDYLHVDVVDSSSGLPASYVVYPGVNLCLPSPKTNGKPDSTKSYRLQGQPILMPQPMRPDRTQMFRTVGMGKTNILLEGGRDPISKTVVHVIDVVGAKIAKSFTGEVVSDIPGTAYDFSVTFESENGETFSPLPKCTSSGRVGETNNSQEYTFNVPYMCIFSPSSLYEGEAIVDPQTGQTYCRGTVKPANKPADSAVTTQPLSLTVKLAGSQGLRLRPREILKQDVAVHVPKLSATVELLSSVGSAEQGSVFGKLLLYNAHLHDDVDVTPVDPNLLHLVLTSQEEREAKLRKEKSPTSSTNPRVYQLVAVQGPFDSTTVNFVSARTGQTLAVLLDSKLHSADEEGKDGRNYSKETTQTSRLGTYVDDQYSGYLMTPFNFFVVGILGVITWIGYQYSHPTTSGDRGPHVPQRAIAQRNPFENP
eukprot:CFRG2907T1